MARIPVGSRQKRLFLTLSLCFGLLGSVSGPVLAQERPPAEGEIGETGQGAAQSFPFYGRLRQAGTREGVAGAKVTPVKGGSVALTDGDGRFMLPAAPAGNIELQIELANGEMHRALALVSGELTPQNLYISPADGGDNPIVIQDIKEDEPIAERRIKAAEIRLLPGALGDPVRVVQNMPGVAWSPLGLGLLIVRGNNPEDSGFFLDGMQIPQVYHFLGVRTIVNAPVLDSVQFYPGGFGVRYGRVLGGVIDLNTKDIMPNYHHGQVSVDLLDSSIFASGPMGEKTNYTFSLRRSYVDTILRPVLERIDIGYRVAPFYWDYMASVSHRPNDNHRVRLMVVGSRDRLEVFGTPSPDADLEEVEAIIDYATDLRQFQFKWDAFFGTRVQSEFIFAMGPQPSRVATSDSDLRADSFNFALREEIRAQIHPTLSLVGGLDLQVINWELSFEYDVDEGTYADELTTISPSPYLEASWRPNSKWTVIPGLRFEPMVVVEQSNFRSLDPRIHFRWEAGAQTYLKGGIGRYSAFPDVLEFIDSLGNENLNPEHSLQTSLGVEQALPWGLNIDFTAYYNHYTDLVVINDDELSTSDLVISDPALLSDTEFYFNEGSGRAYGAEWMLRRGMGGRFWGWVAYSIQRSERRNGPDEDYYLFDYDQTHLLTAVGVMQLPKDWSLGGRFRYGTGRPFIPVIGRTYNLDSGHYSPIYGPYNSARYPNFHSLDIRIERQFTYDQWRLALYLDIQNTYNHANVENHYHSWDYLNLYYIAGMPVLPAFGIQGEW